MKSPKYFYIEPKINTQNWLSIPRLYVGNLIQKLGWILILDGTVEASSLANLRFSETQELLLIAVCSKGALKNILGYNKILKYIIATD